MRQLLLVTCVILAAGCGGSSSGAEDGPGDGTVDHDASDGGVIPDGKTPDGSGTDGCVPAADQPDDQFADTNSDGIDGDATNAVFVAADGSANAAGTRDDPLASINDGIQMAAASGKDVYVSTGTYFESLVLANGVSIYGGYDRGAGWKRSSSTIATAIGGTAGVRGQNLSNPIRLEYLALQSVDALTPGDTSHGMWLVQCADVTLHQVTVEAGRGADGAGTATPAARGLDGLDGGTGGVGESVNPPGDYYPCQHTHGDCFAAYGGGGGHLTTAGHGGYGGSGGYSEFVCVNQAPQSGMGGEGTGGGSGGNLGADGGTGAMGVEGASATTGGGALGSFSASGYASSNTGAAGQDGTPGAGGGGGGAGASTKPEFACILVGGGGGGGGQGGGAGTGGAGGGGGGGSIGLFLWQTSVTLDHSGVTAKAGGRGGLGQSGGDGGSQGFGAEGGAPATNGTGHGGHGGDGGRGGRGGGGAGGGGGPSFGVVLGAGSTWQATFTTINYGSGGLGGSGGSGTAAVGAAGTSAETYTP